MNHTQLLNYLAEKHNLKSYLEIGVQNPANNFNKIICELKHGVDPDPVRWDISGMFKNTSDNYFGMAYNVEGETWKFDLIFIDGLHHADQVQRDFENSLRCLNDGGYIVIHDVLPELEIESCVPRGSQKRWMGDVYKFCMTIKNTYDGVDFITYDFDCGCMVVWKDKTKKKLQGEVKPNWQNYIKHKKEVLNISNEPVRI